MTRALLTGAGGFVGSNLARRLLAENVEVHLILRDGGWPRRLAGLEPRFGVTRGDLSREATWVEAFSAVLPDVVFHLATPRGAAEGAARRLVEDNVSFALNLVGRLRAAPSTKVVVAGSSLEYGDETTPHKEDAPLAPTTWHGVGKAAVTLVVQQAVREFGARVSVLRLFHVYGPWESPNRLVSSAVRSALEGTRLALTRPGIRRDWIHVDDVCDALLAAAADPSGEVLNVGSGTETANEEIVRRISQLLDRPVAVDPGAFAPRVTDCTNRRADLEKIKMCLGWSPRHDLDTGLASAVRWFCDNPDWLSSDESSPKVC